MKSYKLKLHRQLILILAIFAAKCVFYGHPGETGSTTANGEKFDPLGPTCTAPKHIGFDTMLEVTNQRTGRSVQVRVNDRFPGPPKGDTLDLTFGAFGKLAKHHDGEFPCDYKIL